MTTAQQIINGAAKFAGILAEGNALEGGINSDALTRLNRMLDRWQNNGVDLGLGPLTASSTLYVDPADEECIELQLALRLMARHRRPTDGGLSEAARDALTELQAKYEVIKELSIDIAMTHRKPYNVRTE